MHSVMDKKEIRCATCNLEFIPTRSDAQYCSPACRQKAYRQSKPKVTTELALRSELTPRQRAFVEAYASMPNAKTAAITAGYSERSARQIGSRLLTRVDIKSAIRARTTTALEKLEVSDEMTLQELAVIAFSNIQDFVEWDKDGDLVVKPSAEIPRHLAAAIESIDEQVFKSENKDGTRQYTRVKRKIKLYNKLDALKTLSEYLGITDSMAPKIQVFIKTGIDRTPLPVDVEAEPVVGNPPENRAPESP